MAAITTLAKYGGMAFNFNGMTGRDSCHRLTIPETFEAVKGSDELPSMFERHAELLANIRIAKRTGHLHLRHSNSRVRATFAEAQEAQSAARRT